jgi:cold shock CspA family protein
MQRSVITFNKDFRSIDRYVQARLEGIGLRAGRVMEYLALVTRFAQTGITSALVRRLLGVSPDANINLAEVFDEGPATLILEREERVKLLHPLIAEEVLQQRIGGTEHKYETRLRELAEMFIEDVVKYLPADSEEMHDLFFQVFISRMGASDTDDEVDEGAAAAAATRSRFSELVLTIPTKTEQHQLLTRLTLTCPEEPHYWNHLGRHQMYEMEDFDAAQQSLLRAVELSQGKDAVHLTTLGVVRRNWITHLLDRLFASETIPTPEQVLDRVEDLADKAEESFAAARDLREDSNYAYVPHIQLVHRIAERLARAAGARNIDQLMEGDDRVARWLRQHVTLAQDLLDILEHRLGGRTPPDLVRRCQGGLRRLYGDFDSLISSWESLLQGRPPQEQNLRRALVSVYRDRRGRVWANLPVEDLRRIAELMGRNIAESVSDERDVRNWFQAYKRLPEFSFLEAIARLEGLVARTDSVDAHYYLYVLHFLRWYDGAEDTEDLTLFHRVKCEQLAEQSLARDHAYEWLGKSASPCPLVHFRELGEWDRDRSFYSASDEKLVRIGATIGHIETPRRGWIKIGEKIDAFFTPRQFFRGQDEGQEVTFYLGFTFEGPRAYDPKRGKGASLPRDEKRVETVLRQPLVAPDTSPRQPAIDPGESERRVLYRRAKKAAVDFVAAASARGKDLDTGVLGSKLKDIFPGEPVHARSGYGTFAEFLRSIPELSLEIEGTRQLVRLSGKSGGELAEARDAQRAEASIEAESEDTEPRTRGTVTKWKQVYGFIRADDVDGSDVFVHYSDIEGGGFRQLAEGDVVEFVRDKNARGFFARKVRRVVGAEPT